MTKMQLEIDKITSLWKNSSPPCVPFPKEAHNNLN